MAFRNVGGKYSEGRCGVMAAATRSSLGAPTAVRHVLTQCLSAVGVCGGRHRVGLTKHLQRSEWQQQRLRRLVSAGVSQ